jgi:hypothetical protein
MGPVAFCAVCRNATPVCRAVETGEFMCVLCASVADCPTKPLSRPSSLTELDEQYERLSISPVEMEWVGSFKHMLVDFTAGKDATYQQALEKKGHTFFQRGAMLDTLSMHEYVSGVFQPWCNINAPGHFVFGLETSRIFCFEEGEFDSYEESAKTEAGILGYTFSHDVVAQKIMPNIRTSYYFPVEVGRHWVVIAVHCTSGQVFLFDSNNAAHIIGDNYIAIIKKLLESIGVVLPVPLFAAQSPWHVHQQTDATSCGFFAISHLFRAVVSNFPEEKLLRDFGELGRALYTFSLTTGTLPLKLSEP